MDEARQNRQPRNEKGGTGRGGRQETEGAPIRLRRQCSAVFGWRPRDGPGLHTDSVTDISPVRALPVLQMLNCGGTHTIIGGSLDPQRSTP